MANMQALDAYLSNPPLAGMQLIEASAGTGKTYTLAALYLHLILAQRQVEQILVVTYTKAATAELQTRIRERLHTALQAFTCGQAETDPLLTHLLTQYDGPARALAMLRLRYALRSFERAAIYTIHGFCQRVLQDFPLLTGHSPNLSLRKNMRPVTLALAEDFWRKTITQAHPVLAGYLVGQQLTPEKLLAELPTGLRHHTQVLTVENPPDLEPLWDIWVVQYHLAKNLWAEAVSVAQLMEFARHGQLHGKTHTFDILEKVRLAWERYFAAAVPLLPHPKALKQLERLGLNALLKGRTQKTPAAFHTVLQHPLWQTLEAFAAQCQQLQAVLALHYQQLLAQLRTHCLAALPEHHRHAQEFSYDDLARNLRLALEGSEGDLLATRLRTRYPVALVDEFQDTDDEQLTILQAIYPETCAAKTAVYLVGDPKQAIYRFRGADVYSYLKARTLAANPHHLPKNYRARQGLLDGLNAIYGAQLDPFLQPEIQYHRVEAGQETTPILTCGSQTLAPWQVYWLAREDGRGGDGNAMKAMSKERARQGLLPHFAAEVARLLTQGQIQQTGLSRAVVGNDIAILVRSHNQAAAVRTALEAQGIPSAQQGATSVFADTMAEALAQWLSAVLEPTREEVLRGALAGPLYGYTAPDLAALTSECAAWALQLENFWGDHELWQQQGFIAMFHGWIRREQVATRLLAQARGERQLTNLLHLGELLHQAVQQEGLGPHALLRWLQEQRQAVATGTRTEEESHELRLESDAHRVRILTIHKSKGLEFNIVLCPLLWDEPEVTQAQQPGISYHTAAPDYTPVLDLRGEFPEAALQAATLEAQAETARLLYVALTRAKLCCYVGFSVRNEATACNRLFQPWLGTETPLKFDDAALVDRFCRAAATTAPGAWAVTLLTPETQAPQYPLAPLSPEIPPLAALPWHRPLHPSWWLTSFSALLDADQMGSVTEQPAPHSPPTALPDWADIRQFPKGRMTGRCWHSILEHLDFTRPAPDYRQTQVAQALAVAGFASQWEPTVTAMLGRLLDTPHPALGGAVLSQLPSAALLRELEFHFSGGPLHVNQLTQSLAHHGYPELKLRSYNPAAWGLVHGFIDLVLAHQGRYYLGDYKSNDLGMATTAYHPAQLATVVQEEGYTLQALLYALALHRYLRQRLPDYRYEQHHGGMVFFFLRGLNPHHPDLGIYTLRPSLAVIEALDAYFCAA